MRVARWLHMSVTCRRVAPPAESLSMKGRPMRDWSLEGLLDPTTKSEYEHSAPKEVQAKACSAPQGAGGSWARAVREGCAHRCFAGIS